MSLALFKNTILLSALVVLGGEVVFFYLHHDNLLSLGKEYLWAMPLIFFKSLIKKILVLNFFGMAKLLFMLFWHALKLLFIKFLKTVGIRYGAYFSQQKWQKLSQKFRVVVKKIMRTIRAFQKLVLSLNRLEFFVVLLAFLPVFILLFLFGIGFRMTRDVMVKKGSEIGVTNVAVKTAKKSRGLIARLKQADAWLLQKIAALSKSNSDVS